MATDSTASAMIRELTERTEHLEVFCALMAREMDRIKGILIVQAGAGGTARDRQTPTLGADR